MLRAATVADLTRFDEVIDVRSPGEFAADHAPGAINLPVLDNDERARVGTLYKQVSPFEARKVGAALISHNIARHLETWFADKPRHYRPLVYCWRGGNRSGAMTHILQKIGFAAAQLEGGYKAYRRHVVAELARLPATLHYRVVSGPTGSGKSRLLAALQQAGAQVLDLEGLAAHRGSLLGARPDDPQPAQKGFESAIWSALSRFDPARPVYVESESRRIGALTVPEALIAAMRSSPCIRIEAPLSARVQLLIEDYAHFLAAPGMLNARLAHLAELRGRQTVASWQALASAGAWPELVASLLEQHYDPAYRKSLAHNYAPGPDDISLSTPDLGPASLRALADRILASWPAASLSPATPACRSRSL
ncbi:MAG: tRNA 2-selenouridine(34) synthase MnmH [Thiobacillus sp.]